MIAQQQEIYQLLATSDIQMTNLLFAADEVVWVTWKYGEEKENIPVLRHTIDVIGAYVATGGVLNSTRI